MRKLLSTIACLWVLGIALSAHELRQGKSLTFSMQDYLDLPTYSWPETMLSYKVDFSPAIGSASELSLVNNASSSPVLFQLTSPVMKDGKIISACINFLARLDSGASFSYSLKYAKGQNADASTGCSLSEDAGQFVADNGIITVRIPKTQAGGKVLLNLSSRLFPVKAESVLDPGKLTLRKRECVVEESGPIMTKIRTTVFFDDNARYEIVSTLILGYPFVIVEEETVGIPLSANVSADMIWSGIELKYRFGTMWDRTVYPDRDAWVPIDKPVHTNYSKEDPFWSGQGILEDPSERMLYRMTSFGGNSVREQVPLISFWGDGPTEIGTFVYNHNKWDDLQWGIWQQTPDQSVYFRYKDSHLHFLYPISSGRRSSAVAIHDRAKGETECAAFSYAMDRTGGQLRSSNARFRYMNLLHSRYALLNLNVVKDWVLDYPESSLRKDFPFSTELQRTSPELFMKEMKASAMGEYMCGLNSYPGIHSIAHRPYYGRLIQGYQQNYDKLNPLQRKQAEALFLIAGYVNMTEAMNAIRTCLAGTANMAADGWVVPGLNAAMFPEHPMAPVWKEFFEKSLEIYALFYTRPDVVSYESKGGRWAESLGIYNWAYLKPTITANIALQSTFGTNSFANPYMSSRGRWMVDMLTAPVFVTRKGESTPSMQRVYTAHGAHSGGRFVDQFSLLYEYGKYLENYDPILAENIYWCGRFGNMPEGKKGDTVWDEVFAAKNDTKNGGTNPHLKSEKYTGHGIVLRSGVGTDEELSVHLEQVDKGPNYRWGNQAEGNSGGIYYYAAGKIYSGHENESAGDHAQNDMDNVCNMGIMKDGRFRSVGYNELTEPLYDFGFAQYASVTSVPEPGMSSWPEYESRNVMLAGTDYFLIYDQSGTNWRACNRFAWFVHKEDTLPNIVFLGQRARTDHWTKASTNASYGFYRDAMGSQLTLVTHKNEVRPMGGNMYQPDMMKDMPVYEFTHSQKNYPYIGVYEIQTPSSRDVVFCNSKGIECSEKFYSFSGKTGIARKCSDGKIKLALFDGRSISFGKYGLELNATQKCAVGLEFSGNEAVGFFQNYGEATLALYGVSGGKIYVDGVPASLSAAAFKLPKGKHRIEYTVGTPCPMPSEILYTEHIKGGVVIGIGRSSSSDKVAVELSSDGGQTWSLMAETDKSEYSLTGLKKGKYHVRAVSIKGNRRADCAQEYPVYVNSSAPHYPDGLSLRVHDGIVDLSWGQVLGVRKYQLYRMNPEESKYALVYEGTDCHFIDKGAKGIRDCDAQPTDISGGDYARYYVIAENGRGRSEASPLVYANPASWKCWYPPTELRFKRRSAFWAPPYVDPSQMPPMYYPE